MDTIRIEINHGGEFKTREGIYYYKEGTIDNIYNVDVSALSIDRCLNFLREIGYGNGLKLYYQKPLTTGKESYIFLWNDESVKQLRKDAMSLGYVSLFVDHCAEEKQKNVVEEQVDFADNDVGNENEVDDRNYEEEDYSDSTGDEDDFKSDDDIDIESDVDDELQSIRENKKKLMEGKIDPLKEGNLTEMHTSNGDYNVPIHSLDENDEQPERHGNRSAAQHDEYIGEMPQWKEFVQYELDMLGKIFPQFEDNNDLGCKKVDKMVEEGDSDSFDVPSLQSSDTSDNEEVQPTRKSKKKKQPQPNYPTFNPDTSMEHIEFEPGMIFTSREQLKESIRNYAVAKQRRVFIKRSDCKRMQAKCREGCKWELWASKLNNDEAFQIKTYKREHNCIIVSKQRMVKADWLAKTFGNTIRSNPRWKLKEFAEAITAKYKIQCTLNQCWWAKKIAMAELESVLVDHYGRLWDYGSEVLKTNPGSSVYIKGEVNEENSNPTFQRVYICFDALKKGFLNGCRKIIGLDGCVLKGYVKGELLTAIGRDGNNQMFPIAWAVVELECTESWSSFIKLLRDDLNLCDGFNYTLITDQQKGLKNAIDTILPAAEHRCCARHIYANWKKNNPGHTLKCAFWKAAKASTVADFNICLDEIRSISPFAYDDLLKTNPIYWSRAYFKTMTHCDVVDNNISECFNSWILEARYKPIISMLDHIRVQCMERIHIKRDYMARMDTDLCPRIIRRLNWSIEGSKMCTSTWDGGDKCEVRDKDGNQFEVDMNNMTCSCRKWDLTGIPCCHGCQAILSINAEPESYVDDCFKKATYMRAYSHLMCPMKGSKEWPVAQHTKLLPPKARRMPGRPKKHRRREADEEGGSTKLSRKGIIIKCSRCLVIGHNKATCKTSEADVLENQRKAAEAKKAQSEAAKAHSLRNKQNVRKKTHQTKKGQTQTSTNPCQKKKSIASTEPPTCPKKRGRPPKAAPQVQKVKKTSGVGVFVGDDGHTYLSSSTTTMKVTSSQPTVPTHGSGDAKK